MSSVSGTDTAVLTVLRAEAVRDEGSLESQWAVGRSRDNADIVVGEVVCRHQTGILDVGGIPRIRVAVVVD